MARRLLLIIGGLLCLSGATHPYRLVLVGDSIIANWPNTNNRQVTNAGIHGNTTDNLLCRFPQILDAAPDAILLEVGTNDLTGRRTPAQITAHIWALTQAARARNIKVIVATILPTGASRQSERPNVAIDEINRLLKDAATERGYSIIDFNAAVRDASGMLPASLSPDDLHLNEAGYARLEAAYRSARR